jgi:hypothetical protein
MILLLALLVVVFAVVLYYWFWFLAFVIGGTIVGLIITAIYMLFKWLF